MIQLPFQAAVEIVATILEGRGYSASCARTLAENCVSAQRDGSTSHGLFRLTDYLSTIDSGYVNGDPIPRIEDVAPGVVRVDADNGFAPVALKMARDLLSKKARRNGIALLAIRNSHHLGALHLDVEGFANEGLVAMAFVNSDVFVAPPGARHAVYGTNPMAFAAPRAGGPPLVFDQASATMAHGNLQVAARGGRQLPSDTGIDAHGRPTGDPQAILDGGALSAFGRHKGASVALMVEVMCAALVGAEFSHEAARTRPAGASTVRTGETVVLIDPRAGAQGVPDMAERIEVLVSALLAAGQERIPGERSARARHESGDFVRVDDEQWAAVQRLHTAVEPTAPSSTGTEESSSS